MNKNNIEEYSSQLKNLYSNIKKTDVCYGKQGLILFYLYKYKLYNKKDDYDYYNSLIEDCINELILNDDFIGIIEFLYIYFLYQKEFTSEYDLSDIVENFEKIIFSYMLGCIERGNIDGYSGAGYVMNYFLLKSQNSNEIHQIFSSFIKKNIINKNDKTSYIKLNGESKENDFGITHGLSFIIKVYIDLYKNGYLQKSDFENLNKFINNIKENYKNFISYNKKINIVYGCIGILYSLILYNSIFKDIQVDKIIKYIFKYMSKNKNDIYLNNNNTLMYGNSGIILFYNIIKDRIDPAFNKDFQFWNSKINEILNYKSDDFSLAEGKIGQFLTYMSIELQDYRFMNLFFLHKI